MAYLNGRLPSAALSAIPGGHLRHDAAIAWNDMRQEIGEKHGVWIRPTGSQSSYRTYDQQVRFWNLYISGSGNLAARPGTSNHGWGTAVDVATQEMVAYIKRYGPKYGWKKIEAFGEWWHYNYVGGYKRPRKLNPRRFNTVWEKLALNRLEYHREGMDKYRGKNKAKFTKHLRWARFWKARLTSRANKLYAAGKKRGWKWHNVGTRQKAIRDVVDATKK